MSALDRFINNTFLCDCGHVWDGSRPNGCIRCGSTNILTSPAASSDYRCCVYCADCEHSYRLPTCNMCPVCGDGALTLGERAEFGEGG